MNKPDLIIFDLDGVLVDSEIITARAEAQILSEAGMTLSTEEIADRFAGAPFREILLTIERETGKPVQASMIERAEEYVNERLRREATAMQGVHAVVAAMPRRCVCTNASRKRLAILLEKTGLAPLFADHVFSAEETESGKSKPAPDVYLHAARRMNADPARTFVVEDTARGVKAAIAAGMRVIGFTGGSHSFAGHADALTEAGAETVINRWSAFLPVLLALSQWRES